MFRTPPDFWARTGAAPEMVKSNAPAAANARRFRVITVNLPLFITKSRYDVRRRPHPHPFAGLWWRGTCSAGYHILEYLGRASAHASRPPAIARKAWAI